MTGVKSPWILGKLNAKTERKENVEFNKELGIDFA